MEITSLLIGGGIIALGLLNLWLLRSNPAAVPMLDEFKRTLGERNGAAAHFSLYVGLPLFGGGLYVLSGLL